MIGETDVERRSCRIKARAPRGSATRTQMLIGEFMKKYARILVAITFLLGLSVAAKAEIRPQVVVTLPFEFVVNGKTLPAGTYTVKRFSEQPFDVLMLSSNDNGINVFVRPVAMEDASTYKPKVSFHKVGEQHFLTAIQTADYVYNFSVSRSVILAATAKPHDTVSGSGSAGSN
jgi:hypothetical protein